MPPAVPRPQLQQNRQHHTGQQHENDQKQNNFSVPVSARAGCGVLRAFLYFPFCQPKLSDVPRYYYPLGQSYQLRLRLHTLVRGLA